MKSSYLTNLILLVIVIALLWLTQHDNQETEPAPSLSELTADDVTQILIQRGDKPQIELKREQDGWFLITPFTARANETRIKLLLSLLSSPLHGQFQPLAKDSLGQFGLSQPQIKMSMNGQTFAFGQVESLSQHRYVLHNDMIYLIQDDVTPLLTANATSFIENRLLAENEQIRRLKIPMYNSEQSHFSRFVDISQSQGQWQSDDSKLSSDSLKTLVDSWQHAYAMHVSYLSVEQLELLPQPQIQLWLQGNAEPMQLIITLTEQNLLLTNPDTQLQYSFPLALRAQLLPSHKAP
ncbi:DUF4340 domain-containing protein [Methylophaga sp. OBS4]|uniref:DUF4340 domain-containing protein n=1 Tax=Methylophaga sp. OBS4 TaxID=2991935 RepID=UPI00225B4C32|nr:DUF4340 domain-containing protein [Methylophaga sp. OBS4]MCX4188520.1 DUF4340 domain-containing protein [Methylophaga sp. OBS4]